MRIHPFPMGLIEQHEKSAPLTARGSTCPPPRVEVDYMDMDGSSLGAPPLYRGIIGERSGISTSGSLTTLSPTPTVSSNDSDPGLETHTPDQADEPVGPTELGRRSQSSLASASTDVSIPDTSSARRSVSDGPTPQPSVRDL